MSSRLFTVSLALLISSSSFAFTDSVWIVGAEGYPGDLITAEIWLQYEGGGPGDSIIGFDIPLTYDASVCTVEAITIGTDFWPIWRDFSTVDNQGTQGPPEVPKISVCAVTSPAVISWYPIPRGTHLAATVDFRILGTVLPPDSTCLDTLVQGFTPTRHLCFAGKERMDTCYIPSFSADCI